MRNCIIPSIDLKKSEYSNITHGFVPDIKSHGALQWDNYYQRRQQKLFQEYK